MKRISCLAALALWTLPAAANDALFDPVRESLVRISPSGDDIAFVVTEDSQQHVTTLNLETKTRRVFFSTREPASEKPRESAITALDWVDNDTLLFRLVEFHEGVAELSDTRNTTHLFVLDTAGSDDPDVRYIETTGTVISTLPTIENEILFSRPGSTSIVYRIDTSRLNVWGQKLGKTARRDGGEFTRQNRLAEIEGLVVRWISDRSGAVRAALRWNNEDGFALVMRENDEAEWVVEKSWPRPKKKPRQRRQRNDDEQVDDPIYIPIALLEETNDFIVFGEDDAEKSAVYRYNYGSGTKTELFRHPTAELMDVGLNYFQTDVLFVSYFDEGLVKNHYLNSAYREVADTVGSQYPNYTTRIVAADANDENLILYMSSPVQPGRAFAYSRSNDSLTEIFSLMPWLKEDELADSVVGKVASGNLQVEYYLTVPKSAQPVPLLVFPHGGPWAVRDNREFDPAVQYMASQGFAVLQVNYRGSSGYGKEFLQEGHGEFGSGMLDDIEAAMRDVMAKPDIDGSNVCAIGHSYGGYAALMLSIRRSDTIQCVVSMAGVTDLGLLVGSYDRALADVLLPALLPESVAPKKKYDALREISPLFLAEEIDASVLLAHGTEDRRVDVEHGRRLKQRLEQLGKAPEWREYEDLGHSFNSSESALNHYRAAIEFIRAELGLRSSLTHRSNNR